MTARAGIGARALLVESARTAAGLAAVIALAAAILSAADAVPTYLAGHAHDVKRARSVDEAERRLRARLLLPFYFPQTLEWPPERIRFVLGPPAAVALSVDARGGGPRLLIAQTLGPGPIPERLVPPAQEVGSSPVAIGPNAATLARVIDEDGTIAFEVRWTQVGRSMLLRTRGSVDELLRMARSTREAP